MADFKGPDLLATAWRPKGMPTLWVPMAALGRAAARLELGRHGLGPAADPNANLAYILRKHVDIALAMCNALSQKHDGSATCVRKCNLLIYRNTIIFILWPIPASPCMVA